MQNPSYIALSSQMALERQMDVIANNLANQTTPAFKGEEMLFSQYLIAPPGNDPLAFVQDRGTARDMRQGPITDTGSPLDLAIEGSGYFTVDTPLGPRYTRNGHFVLDADNQIVTSEGYPLLGLGDQPLAIPQNTRTITVAQDGTVSVSISGTPASTVVGRVQVVDFAVPQAVTPGANGLWVTDQTPEPAAVTVQQGMIEQSNIEPVVELTRMMAVARASGTIKNFLDEESQRHGSAIDRLAKIY